MLTTLSLLTTTINLDLETAATTEQLSGSTSTFGDFLSTAIQASMVIAALIVLLYLVWAGIDWVTAGGDNGKIEKARTKITQSILGIIVLASSIALFMVVQRFLGISVVNVEDQGHNAPPGRTRSAPGWRPFDLPK